MCGAGPGSAPPKIFNDLQSFLFCIKNAGLLSLYILTGFTGHGTFYVDFVKNVY